jgi:hypothetical protein
MLCKARGHCKYRTICRSLLVINFFGHFTLVSFLFTKNAGNLLFGFYACTVPYRTVPTG